jgi:hypothetical protein
MSEVRIISGTPRFPLVFSLTAFPVLQISPGGGLSSGLITGRMVAHRIAKDAGLPWLPSAFP